MARLSRRQFSFSNGEVSREVWGRGDMEFYFSALAKAENIVTDQVGVIHRRPPTLFDLVTPDPAYFYTFQTADDRSVVIVAQPTYFLFLVDGEVVQVDDADFQLFHSYGADYSDLRVEPDLNVAYISHPNHYDQVIDVSGSVFTLTDLRAYPFDDLNRDRACQLLLSAGGTGGGTTGFIRPLNETTGTVLTLRAAAFDPEFTATVVENLGAGLCSVTLSAVQETGDYELDTSGVGDFSSFVTITLQVDRATLTAIGCAPFTSEMIGQNIRILDEGGDSSADADPNTWLVLSVLDVVSATEAVVGHDGLGITATDLFQLPLLVDGKRTRAALILDDRLWLAVENAVIGSETSDFLGFRPTDESGNVNPDNAIKRKFTSKIHWLRAMGRQVVVGTARQVFSLLGAGVSGAFAADGTAQQKNDKVSCADKRPAEVTEGILFIDGSRRKLYRTGFFGQYDQVSVFDQSLFVPHFGAERFAQITYQESPFSICWAVTDTGRLLSHTVWPQEQVRGWARHRLGGRLVVDGVETAPRVYDVQAAPRGTGDAVYLSVERTVNGASLFTVEHMEGRFDAGIPFIENHHLDCSFSVKTEALGSMSFSNGPEGNVALANGQYAATDGQIWVPFTVEGGAFVADAPNTDDEPVPGRDFVLRDGSWIRLGATPEGGQPGFSPSTEDVFRPAVGVTEIRSFIETATGLEFLEGESVSVYADGQWRIETVSDGSVPIGGAVAFVGFSVDAVFDFLPARVNLGGTDGANDPVQVIEGAALVENCVIMEVGTGRRNEYLEQSISYEPVDFDDPGLIMPQGFSGWVTLRPFSDLSDNDESLISCRLPGPWPCTVSSVELTLDMQGGR